MTDEVYEALDCLTTVANRMLVVNLVMQEGHENAVMHAAS